MRLIDADALLYSLGASDRDMYVAECINEAPTVEAVVLPCKPGTTVYMLHNNTDACSDCPHHAVYFDDADCTHPDYETYLPAIQDSPVCDKHFWEVIDHTATELFLFNHREKFGKTVFLTRVEAETAIAKMKGGESHD